MRQVFSSYSILQKENIQSIAISNLPFVKKCIGLPTEHRFRVCQDVVLCYKKQRNKKQIEKHKLRNGV